MTGELFFKTANTKVSGVSDWVDAYTRYGLSLEDGSRARLRAPAPMKAGVSNSSAVTNGVAYLASSIGKKDERTVSLAVHIVGIAHDDLSAKEDYEAKFDDFCTEVLDCGYIKVRLGVSGPVFHMLYVDCQPFDEFCGEMAKFTLSLKEPHPEIRHE